MIRIQILDTRIQVYTQLSENHTQFSKALGAVLHFFQQMAMQLHFSNNPLATHSELQAMAYGFG